MVKVSLEKFVKDCQTIRGLVTEAVEDSNLPYISVRGLRSGAKIMGEVIQYFGDLSHRKPTDDASLLQRVEFGLQTLRDSCMIAEEEGRGEMLTDLRAIINAVGEYSIKTGYLEYSFSKVVIPSKTN